jgi:phospholipase C
MDTVSQSNQSLLAIGNTTVKTQPNTHIWMAHHAINLIQNQSMASQKFYDRIKSPSSNFYPALCQGLWDADKKAPFNNPFFGRVPTWASHFYDPDSGTNWLGHPDPTAVTCGSRYYDLARESYLNGDFTEAGYYLGLSLHYLTDLTQPMHAANFTWLDSWHFGYHTAFEKYACRMLAIIPIPARYTPLIDAHSPADFLKAVARRTKDRFYPLICRPEWTQSYNRLTCTEAIWQERVGHILSVILTDAIQITAQYTLTWSESVWIAPPLASQALHHSLAALRAVTEVASRVLRGSESPAPITRQG